MNLIFAGTPEFAATALQALHDAGHTVTLVLTRPDRPAGRGMQLQASAVKQWALRHDIPVAQPVSLRLDGKHPEVAAQAHALLRATPHEVMVVAAYGLILPRSVLDIPPQGCLNIHASLLPRWRGAAPIHRAIEAGDAETGVTIMQMDEGLDTGPMLLEKRLPIAADDTTATLHDRLARLGGDAIVEALGRLERGTLARVPQPAQGVQYAAKILKEESALDFHQPADVVARKIRALNPFPGAHADYRGTLVKIWNALDTGCATDSPPGSILAANAQEGILVACGGGVVRLTELQKPGGKRLAAAPFLLGFALEGSFDPPAPTPTA